MSILKKPSLYLAGSLGLNVFLVGVLLGHCGGPGGFGPRGPRPDFDRPDGPPNAARMMQDFSRDLPPPDADKMKAIFAEQGKVFDGHRDSIKAAMGKVADVLGAKTVDKAALTEALAAIAAVNNSLHENMSALILRAADELSPEGRRKFADTLKKGPPGAFKGDKSGKRDGFRGPPPHFMDGPDGRKDLPPQGMPPLPDDAAQTPPTDAPSELAPETQDAPVPVPPPTQE